MSKKFVNHENGIFLVPVMTDDELIKDALTFNSLDEINDDLILELKYENQELSRNKFFDDFSYQLVSKGYLITDETYTSMVIRDSEGKRAAKVYMPSEGLHTGRQVIFETDKGQLLTDVFLKSDKTAWNPNHKRILKIFKKLVIEIKTGEI